ncbi:unnamed protein product [Owenia fusiformis]|uniref:Peptidase S54 rhomboid domain-containing protein n=1 Tax=Owenia fusiformis TaxID=6347 RepID=A0A8J1UBK2_OWEFU|nr:unnamed protein product [Owenia fusiformis]
MLPQRRSRGQGMGLMLLALQLLSVGFDKIPPTTLSTILANVAIYLKLFRIPWLPTSLGGVCVSIVNVWYRQEWMRVLLAAFYHADDWHLYYNMVSFLWKGLTLERKLGSGYFLYVILVFSILVNGTLLGLNVLLEYLLQDPSYAGSCAVGFSGVVFALKVLSTHFLPPGTQLIMGFIPVPSRIACWVELVVIQLLVPNASFTGHLAGILVGLAFVKGPLRAIMDFFVPTGRGHLFRSYTYHTGSTGHSGNTTGRTGNTSGHHGNTNNYYSNTTGNSNNRNQNHSNPYSDLTGGLSEEAQIQEAIRRSQGNEDRGTDHSYNESVRRERQQQTSDDQSGLSDEEQMAEAIRRSRNEVSAGADNTGGVHLYPTLPSEIVPPPQPSGIAPPPPEPSAPSKTPPEVRKRLNAEELRSRRLKRFEPRFAENRKH